MSSSAHLILLSVGPVQSFIAQARKLRDLRSGSRLLGELTAAAIGAFRQNNGQVIVPGLLNPSRPQDQGLPNRLLGKVSAVTTEQAAEIARALETAVRERWAAIVAEPEVQKQLNVGGGAADWQLRFDEQIAQVLEVYWAVEPYTDDDDYARAYRQIEARLGSVKNARTFQQIGSAFGGDETSRKDALTGERDALVFGFGESRTKSGWPATTDQELPRRLRDRGALVGPNEGLSAVSAVKRFRRLEDQRFDSTADIALLGLERRLAQTGGYTISDFNTVVNRHQSGGDGQLAFAENLTRDYFEKQGLVDKADRLVNIQRAQSQLKRAIKDADLKQTSYYAVLAFDGDHMGSWLSGDNLGDSISGEQLRKFHSAIGECLAKFGQAATALVNEGHGITVYAGGDDYLGALTLDSIFVVLPELRKLFRTMVSDELQRRFQIPREKEFTFSAGLVIAHYKRPLGDTVQLAQAAEKAAKIAGRDALCMRIVKRSGEQQETVLPWRLSADGSSETMESLRLLVAALQGHSGRAWLTESTRTVNALFGTGEISLAGREYLQPELRRLVRRAFAFGHDLELRGVELQEQTTEALAALGDLLEITSTTNSGSEVRQGGARNFVFALQVIDFLKRELNTLEPQLALS